MAVQTEILHVHNPHREAALLIEAQVRSQKVYM